MKANETDTLAEQLRQTFDRSVESLDGETLARIGRARRAALERPARQPRYRYWLPAGAVAAYLAVFLYGLPPRQQQVVEEKPFIDDVEIISELEFYEDLEFYRWLELHELPS